MPGVANESITRILVKDADDGRMFNSAFGDIMIYSSSVKYALAKVVASCVIPSMRWSIADIAPLRRQLYSSPASRLMPMEWCWNFYVLILPSASEITNYDGVYAT